MTSRGKEGVKARQPAQESPKAFHSSSMVQPCFLLDAVNLSHGDKALYEEVTLLNFLLPT